MSSPAVPVDAAAGSGRLAVLLATYNGASYLDEQLASVQGQDWARIDVWASDDASSDETPARLEAWAERWAKGSFTILGGPRTGFAGNFRALLGNPAIEADYYAYCDQDDVWLPGKTRAAVAAIAAAGTTPALFGSRTIIVDAGGVPVDRSPLFRRAPGFRNAIVQNIGGGNTMVMNRAAFRLVAEGARRTGFVSHDWFAYLLVSGAGGLVVYSPDPEVHYRQHGANLVGSNHGFEARLRRLRAAFDGRFVDWNNRNTASLAACRDLLTPEARGVLDEFSAARHGPLAGRLAHLVRSGAYRQTAFGQLSLFLACLVGKL